jgi:hypothetical protein
LALKDKEEKEKENKRHTMSHPPDHIPELDSPRQSRSPIKKDKKERVSSSVHFYPQKSPESQSTFHHLFVFLSVFTFVSSLRLKNP